MTYKRKTIDYSQHQRDGHVPEQDGHFTVTFLPIIDGFNCHDIKKRPALSPDQWVEVIHRNGERSRGPVDTYAWTNHPCSGNDRMDYILRKTIRSSKPAFEILDLEITHYRTTPTPPENWVNGVDPWPFAEDEKVAA